MSRFLDTLKLVGPGILVAATGVGAGDLATGALTGSLLGTAVLWAVLVGAIFKFTLNEGLTRWQLSTKTTLLEGCFQVFGLVFQILFLLYLLLWTFFVASALMSACGVVMHAILPVWGSPDRDKIGWGITHSAVAVLLVITGGYRLFEKVMTVCIGVMFVTVTVTAALIRPDFSELVSGLLIPTIPDLAGEGLDWTVALLGGIGGTLTILCYGYWIREEGRTRTEELGKCRLDLASGYTMTALFGIAMVIIGSKISIAPGSSSQTIVLISDELQLAFGNWGEPAKWIFLVGAWGAVASSLLGVWQSVPYMFTDVYNALIARLRKQPAIPVSTTSWPYRCYLIAMAIFPVIALSTSFKTLQKVYAICGAMMIPALAVILLILGNSRKLIGEKQTNPLWNNLLLVAVLLFFSITGVMRFNS